MGTAVQIHNFGELPPYAPSSSSKLLDISIATHLEKGEGGGGLPVRKGTGTALVHGTTDWVPQVPRVGGVREEEAGVRAGPIEVGVVHLPLGLE